MKAATGIQPRVKSVRERRLRLCGREELGQKLGSALKPEYFEDEDDALVVLEAEVVTVLLLEGLEDDVEDDEVESVE